MWQIFGPPRSPRTKIPISVDLRHPCFPSRSDKFCFVSAPRVRVVCLSLRAKEEISMARKVGRIIARGDRRWLIRFYLGRDHEINKCRHHNRTITVPIREAQAYLTKSLRERDLGRDWESAKITLNEYLDRWLEVGVFVFALRVAL